MGWMTSEDKLMIGHSGMDREHLRLAGLINQLDDGIKNLRGEKFCDRVLDDIIRLMQSHFAVEEHLMAKHRYAKLADHKREHELIIRMALKHKACIDEDASASYIPTHDLLESALTSHILTSDKALAEAISPSTLPPLY